MDYIDLKLYFSRLLKNWLLVALCSILGMTIAFIYSKFFATPMYSSTVKIGVFNTDWTSNVSVTDIETTSRLITNCIVVIQDDVMAGAVVDVVKETTGKVYSVGQVKSALSVSQIGESQWLQIRALTTDPELSALFCNAFIATARDVIIDNVANVEMKSLGEAKVNYSPVSPNTTKNVITGFAFAFIGICLVIFLLVYFDKTVSSEEILKEKFDVAVLGIVPNIEVTSKDIKDIRSGRFKKRSKATL